MKRLVLGGACAFSLLALLCFMAPPIATAAINPQISFQGKLTNTDGTNVTDGNYSIRFRIYTSPSADGANTCSANSCKWEETQATVAVSGGLFQVNLGSVTTLPASVDFNTSALYLGIKVGSDAEMTPRVQLTAAPYAFNTDLLDGMDSGSFIQLSPGAQQTGNINISGTVTSGAVNGVSLGSTIQPSAAGALTVQSNGANALTLTGGAASTLSTTSGALTITSATAATWSTTSGNLTIQAGSGTVSLGSSTTLTATGALTFSSGAATALTVDSGTTGALNIGTSSNAKTITMGNTTGTTSIATFVGGGTNAFSIQGASGAVYTQLDTTNGRLYIGNPTADGTAFALVLDSKNTTGDPGTAVNGSEYYNSFNNKFRCYEGATWKNCTSGAADTFSTIYGPIAATSAKAAAATILIAPIYVSGQITVNEMRVNVTTALGAAGDVGIYNAAGTRVLNGGSSSLTTTAGLKTVVPTQTGTARILEPGQYYAAVTWNSTTGIIAGSTIATGGLTKRVGTITGGGLVLPATLTLSSITIGTVTAGVSINN